MTISSTATLSRCKKYRYDLERCWSTSPSKKNTVVFIGLNPSTADASIDDPTIRKCVAFAHRWGFSKLIMVNLFAWRATDPSELLITRDPIGKQNDWHIENAIKSSSLVIACWGEPGSLMGRSDQIRAKYAKTLMCLKTNKSGEPTHPLYLPASLTPHKLTNSRTPLK